MRPMTLMAALALPTLLGSIATAQADEILRIERASDRAARDRVVKQLAKHRIDLRGEELSIRAVAKHLRAATDDKVNFVPMRKSTDTKWPTVTLDLKQRSLLQAMGVVSRMTKLRFVYRAGLIQIKPADEVIELAVLRMYDLSAAVIPVKNKPGPILGLRVPGEDREPEEPAETGDTLSGLTLDRIESLLQERVDPDSWDRPGVSIRSWNGVLMIRQTAQNHVRVEALLHRLGVITRPTPKKTNRRKANKEPVEKPASRPTRERR